MAKARKKVADKVKDAEFFNIDAVAKMTEGQYWEWRATMEELQNAKLKSKVAELQKQTMELQVSEMGFKAKLEAFKAQDAAEHTKKISVEYQDFRKRLEDKLGVSLADCSIDPINFEIIPLNKEGS